ncbi:Protein N-acetyltransferase, RimJ/RimL family [Hymenobacter daecheongensis DSM 21074]|uniref:Protein N-acetyltransferase, RimJ/RimL family n=1 Tax=Hymenobacter daecheongensis DSM 21074 TaxID=1121955 RepID=A0A1M6GTY4_9BACT|nr:GNAT family protein [Hymenobacter daecheongensis]SHJ13408.1 Protein N-acetyltransferase, RimJ/RimL family [Hymenobacter daecheongensis DSM 21074]
MPETFLIETPRLRLRTFQLADVAAFAAYRAAPEVARFQSWEPYSYAQAADFVAAQAGQPIPAPPGTWVQIGIALAATNELVGDCALCLAADEPRQGEIGITLAPAWQGRGYAAEALRGLFAHCFETLGLHRLIAVTDCENVASVRLLGSVGMRREAHFRQNIWFKGAWGDEYVYALLREEWPIK